MPDRKVEIDHRKLARALLHLAQAEYDETHVRPEEPPASVFDRSSPDPPIDKE